MTAKTGSLRPFNRIFLLGLAPLISIMAMCTIDDPIFSQKRDFGVFWTASTMLWRGDVLLLFDPDTYRAALLDVMGPSFGYLPFPYPPHSLFFLAPLKLFPYLIALAIWLAIGFAAVIAALWQRIDQRWVMLVALLLCPASTMNMAAGQNGFLSAALLCGGLLQLDKRPVLAGILFGLLSYKPQLGLIIPLLLMTAGHWRAFWAASVTVVLMVAASAALFGIEAWQIYLTKSGPMQLHVAQYWVGRFQFMSPTYFMAGRLLGLELWQAWAMQAASTVLTLACTVWIFRQPGVPHRLKCAIAMLAVFLVSPYALTYDLIIISAAILLGAQCFQPKWWEGAVCGMAWLLPALTLPPGMPIGPIVITMVFLIYLRRAELMRVEHARSLDATGDALGQS